MFAFNRLHALVLLIISAFFSPPSRAERTASSDMLVVSGWNIKPLTDTAPPPNFGEDPVIGRLTCPALTRLDLSSGSSEPFFFKDISATKGVDNHVVWKISLRPGSFWWSGAPVTADDVTKFITEALNGRLRQRLELLGGVPKFTVKKGGEQSLAITWQAPPAFGPYVFDGLPLWRETDKTANEKDALKFECAGRYKPRLEKDDVLTLTPTKSLGGGKFEIHLVPATHPLATTSSRVVAFKSAGARRGDDAAGQVSAPKCLAEIDLPLVSAIVWNLKSEAAKSPDLRKAYTQLLPRGELVRTGANQLGDLVSGPFLRNHPGYNADARVRNFSTEEGAAALEKLGYKRPSADDFRLMGPKTPFVVQLDAPLEAQSFLSKVISDSFGAAGLQVKFGKKDADGGKDSVAGALIGWELPWPGLDYLLDFHSKAQPQYPFQPIEDKSLDGLLEEYSRSLTMEKPDFSKLRSIHRRLFELEPFTILLQHRLCLEATAYTRTHSGKISSKDPDWFWDLVR